MTRDLKQRLSPSWLEISLLSCLLLSAGGCGSGTDDLELWVDEQLAKPGGAVPPLRPIATAPSYIYKGGLKDPFRDFYATISGSLEGDGEAGPEVETLSDTERWERDRRKREELEQFELDTLKMLGILENSEKRWGLVRDPRGALHRVEVGNYIGRRVGKVEVITENRIRVRELYEDAQGRWEKRLAEIALATE